MKNFTWTDEKVTNFVNWYVNLHQLPPRYKMDNHTILNSFKRGEPYTDWQIRYDVVSKTMKRKVDALIKDFCKKYKCTRKELFLRIRERNVVARRYVFFNRLMTEIGVHPGIYENIIGFHHSTIIHGSKTAKILMDQKYKPYLPYL
jgi:hypothetical protein